MYCLRDHVCVLVPHLGQIIDSRLTVSIFQVRYIPDVYDLAHVAG